MIFQLPSPESPGSRSRGGAGARRRMRQQEPWTAQTHDRTPAEDAARHAQWLRSRAAATVPDAFHAQALREAERAMKSGKAKFSDWEEAKKRIRRKAAKLA